LAKLADDIRAEVRALEGLDLEGLRAEWRRRFGAPPRLRSSDLLARLLAWRIQEAWFGGLSPETLKLLGQRGAAGGPDLKPGMRLEREWRGQLQTVDVVEQGFRWEGRIYPSLSKVAFAITGVKWNGPRFFGLRDKGADK